MRTFRQWRRDNPTWHEALKKFNFSKRAIRTTVIHPLRYWRYNQLCRRSTVATLMMNDDNQVNLALRPFNKYLNKKWKARQKIAAAQGTLRVLEEFIKPAALKNLFGADAQGIVLATLLLKTGEQAQLKLMHSRFVREGEIGIYLFAPGAVEALYSITFSFSGPHDVLYLCGLQGPKPGEGQDQVRDMTKALYGMRPKNLLLSAAYALADSFGVTTIQGISDRHHIKSHHLKSSYDSFWQELSGEVSTEGWYQLPRQESVKDIEQVESKHRSAFRKREALRLQMREDIVATLQSNLQSIEPNAAAAHWVVSNA